MKRRDFIRYCGAWMTFMAFGHKPSHAKWIDVTTQGEMPQGMLVIDSHSHPRLPTACMTTADDVSALEKIVQIRMNASCFSVVGDSSTTVIPYDTLLNCLECILDLEARGSICVVRKHSDLPRDIYSPHYVPGALLALEGAVCIEDDPGKLDELYGLGVRLVTPMHYKPGELGDIMTISQPINGGLTDKGKAIVEKMCSLGIIIDAAHAHVNTLEPITEIALAHGLPVIDTHTGLAVRTVPPTGTRLRTFIEMEMVAKTGGFVGVWPVQTVGKTDFDGWANEIRAIADRIGIEHVGLGTDGGGIGSAAKLVYESILDLPKLVDALYRAGFKRSEIDAFFGGNMLRVMKAYM